MKKQTLTTRERERERGGDNGLFITHYTSPQSSMYHNVFLIVDLTTLGTFDWLVNHVEYSNVSTTNFNLQKG